MHYDRRVPHRLLVVHGSEPFALRLERYLSQRGFDVDRASELEEAQALLTQLHYAAMVAAWRLDGAPGAAGLELVTHIQNHAPWTRTVLLIGRAPQEVAAEAHARGTHVVLARQPSPPQMARLLARLLA